jgi:hypothetical protein
MREWGCARVSVPVPRPSVAFSHRYIPQRWQEWCSQQSCCLRESLGTKSYSGTFSYQPSKQTHLLPLIGRLKGQDGDWAGMAPALMEPIIW